MRRTVPAERRARMHAALGEPVRLRIVDRLVLGDASPGELGRQVGLPTNLLAHHLKVLDDAGLDPPGPLRGRPPAQLRAARSRRPARGRAHPGRCTASRLGAADRRGVRLHPQLRPVAARRRRLGAGQHHPGRLGRHASRARVHPARRRVGRRHGLRLAAHGPRTSPTSSGPATSSSRSATTPTKNSPAGSRPTGCTGRSQTLPGPTPTRPSKPPTADHRTRRPARRTPSRPAPTQDTLDDTHHRPSTTTHRRTDTHLVHPAPRPGRRPAHRRDPARPDFDGIFGDRDHRTLPALLVRPVRRPAPPSPSSCR